MHSLMTAARGPYHPRSSDICGGTVGGACSGAYHGGKCTMAELLGEEEEEE